MRLKTFTAKSMQEAMAEVRATLGADAIIVSSSGDGKGGTVRLVAAAEHVPTAAAEPDPHDIANPMPTLADVLGHHRLSQRLAAQLTQSTAAFRADEPVFSLAAALDSALRFASLDDKPGKPMMFVGLPGAGKTVAVARLAAEAVLGGAAASVITTDVVRAGGVEQLRHYGQLSGVEIDVADSIDALAATTAAAKALGRSHIFIDTPGVNPLDSTEMDDLAARAAMIDATIVWVLPGGGDAAEAEELAQMFSRIGCARLVATRLDTARRLGGLLAAVHAGDMALTGATMSPFIGDKVEALNPVSLARLMFAHCHTSATSQAICRQQVSS